MPAKSDAMVNFRANVLKAINDDGISVLEIAKRISAERVRRAKRHEKPNVKAVSHTFLYNLLNGHFDCSLPFAGEIAGALDRPLADLIESEKNFAKIG